MSSSLGRRMRAVELSSSLGRRMREIELSSSLQRVGRLVGLEVRLGTCLFDNSSYEVDIMQDKAECCITVLCSVPLCRELGDWLDSRLGWECVY